MRILGALFAAVFLTLVPAVPAFAAGASASAVSADTAPGHPDEPGREIIRWNETFTLNTDGSVNVTLDIDFDFGNDPGHGPYLTLPLRQSYDDTYDRKYTVSNVHATSRSGAPSKVYLTDERNWLTVRVGDENIGNVSGTQNYVITYRVQRVMNATTASELGGAGDQVVNDEFYWNAVGDGWEVPISNATVTVISPVPVIAAQCFAGSYGAAQACDGMGVDGSTATFTQSYLYPGQPFTVDLLYPPNSFETEPALVESSDFKRAFHVNPGTLTGAGAVLVGGILLLVRRLRNTAIDEQYGGLTPGLAPAMGQAETVVRRDYKTPIAVRFEPPAGMRPGQVGTLIDEVADPRDVTATIVDLAVRGYLRIDDLGEKSGFMRSSHDYQLVKLRDSDAGMVAYEATLFDALFKGRDSVTFEGLKTTFAADMKKVQTQLYDNVTQLGWFRRNPLMARAGWVGSGILMLILGIVATVILAQKTSLALIPVPLILVGIMWVATYKHAPARTPAGTAAVQQAQGFMLFLTTADANQLRYEEQQDIFSRYLPYAISFGVAEAWAKKFEELAKQGVKLAEPTWFGGYAYGTFWAHSAGLGQQLTQFSSLADSAISAPTPGSSGGSGFGGGGGFSGGGGGGGGGGGW